MSELGPISCGSLAFSAWQHLMLSFCLVPSFPLHYRLVKFPTHTFLPAGAFFLASGVFARAHLFLLSFWHRPGKYWLSHSLPRLGGPSLPACKGSWRRMVPLVPLLLTYICTDIFPQAVFFMMKNRFEGKTH